MAMRAPLRSFACLTMLALSGGMFQYSKVAGAILPSRAAPMHRLATTLRSSCRQPDSNQHIGIIGGGLAGLSTAYYLLEKAPGLSITVIDKGQPGTGGASAVAGGFLHPLSPKGKLVHLGLEGLSATNTLLDAASKHESQCLLRDEIYRVAVNESHENDLKSSASQIPELAEWIDRQDLPWTPPPDVRGALRLHSGCKVVHVPSYIEGLWKAIESIGTGHKEWIISDLNSGDENWKERLSTFDKVVFAAGSGIIDNGLVKMKLPIQLVRGQSMEVLLKESIQDHAMLCGKYVTPLPEKGRVLVGATHEFKEEALDGDGVRTELQSRSISFVPHLWQDGTVDKITSAYRVQSNRGRFGRLPILGRTESSDLEVESWIFTGLSSRGLLLHGVFGEILASQLLGLDPRYNTTDVDWWHNKVQK